jgi:ketosteroid isomerase-like protein
VDGTTETFLEVIAPRLTEAETALHDGDIRQRVDMWSRTEPLTLFGAFRTSEGWPDVRDTFELLRQGFRDCTSYENEILAARATDDMAYIVAKEHTTASFNGRPRSYVLRATTIFCREDGEWKVVHRHADEVQKATS